MRIDLNRYKLAKDIPEPLGHAYARPMLSPEHTEKTTGITIGANGASDLANRQFWGFTVQLERWKGVNPELQRRFTL
jgi:hypothetical protein